MIKNKPSIILNKIEVSPEIVSIGETRVSEKLQTKEHLIRDTYNLRKNYY